MFERAEESVEDERVIVLAGRLECTFEAMEADCAVLAERTTRQSTLGWNAHFDM